VGNAPGDLRDITVSFGPPLTRTLTGAATARRLGASFHHRALTGAHTTRTLAAAMTSRTLAAELED
jgi:hypothetical protein